MLYLEFPLYIRENEVHKGKTWSQMSHVQIGNEVVWMNLLVAGVCPWGGGQNPTVETA